MAPVWYGLYARVARANQLTSHGRRRLRRQMQQDYRDKLERTQAVLSRYAGQKLAPELSEQIRQALIVEFSGSSE